MYTPEKITKLEPNEMILVGTNMLGNHAGGLAKYAKEHFGLEDGSYLGFSGQCYCIPTLDENFNKVSLENIERDLDMFAYHASCYKETTFYLTKIGTGIAGFTIGEIKSILPKFPKNVILPIEFK